MKGIGIKEVAFVGYAVQDVPEARRFYGDILGLKESSALEHEGEVGWVEYEIPGGQTLAIVKASEQWQPSAHGGGVCFEVENLEAAVEAVRSAGGTIAMPIQDYPVCRMALLADPSGNTIAIHQKKPSHPDLAGSY